MIKVIDNFLPQMYADQIEHDAEFGLMYKYVKHTSINTMGSETPIVKDSNTIDSSGQFVCTLLNSARILDRKFSYYFENIKPLIFTAGQYIDKHVVSVERVKVNLLLQQPTDLDFYHNYAHVDELESHYSMIYYINDTDGDTYLFNECFDSTNLSPDLTLYHRVSPKKNRVVIFESNRYHASSNPKDHATRFIINFVMKVA